MSDPVPDGMICLGVVTGAKGLRGEVRVKSFTEVAETIASYGPLSDESGEKRFVLTLTGQAKGLLLARIDGISDRTRADALKGQRLFIATDQLPPADEGEFYHRDLIGLQAVGPDDSALGRVQAVHDYGAGVILEIAGGPVGVVLVPFTRDVVPVVDIRGGRMVIDPPAGLFDDEPDENDETAEDGKEKGTEISGDGLGDGRLT